MSNNKSRLLDIALMSAAVTACAASEDGVKKQKLVQKHGASKAVRKKRKSVKAARRKNRK